MAASAVGGGAVGFGFVAGCCSAGVPSVFVSCTCCDVDVPSAGVFSIGGLLFDLGFEFILPVSVDAPSGFASVTVMLT